MHESSACVPEDLMRGIVVALALCLLSSVLPIIFEAVRAADLDGFDVKARLASMTEPVASWRGFYVGVNAGGGFGTNGARETGLPTTGALALVASKDFTLDHNASGFVAGGQVGYNMQFNRLVVGIEADIDGANISGTGQVTGAGVAQRNGANGFAGNFVNASEKVDYIGTVRGRVGGLVTDSLLVYATGGLAYGHVNHSGQFHYATPVDYLVNDSTTQVGWTVGAGLEYMLTSRWSVKGEYLYYDLGNHTVISNAGINPLNRPFQSQFDYATHGSIVRAGLNYNLDFAVPVVAKN
jgi:outer membrane immunogenic protein